MIVRTLIKSTYWILRKFPVTPHVKLLDFKLNYQSVQGLTLASLLFSDWIIFSMRAYSASTPNTCMMQDTTQVSTAVRPSALGALAVTELKMLTRTRNRVTRRAMRPATHLVVYLVCSAEVGMAGKVSPLRGRIMLYVSVCILAGCWSCVCPLACSIQLTFTFTKQAFFCCHYLLSK